MTKRVSAVLSSCLGLLLLVDLIAGNMASDTLAVDVAWAVCKEKGWQPADLSMSRSEVSGLLGKTAVVEFDSTNRNNPKHLQVTLRKWINLMSWQVVDYKEK
jgi:hypothetical protein